MKRIILVPALILISIAGFTQAETEKLFTAVKDNDLAAVKQLVAKGANVNATDSNQATVLMWAAYKSDLPAVQYLVSKGADAKKKGVIYLNAEKTGYYGNLLGIAAGEGKLDILKFLVETSKIDLEDKEYDPEAKSDAGWTALQWAGSNGHTAVTEYLIKKGANVNANHTPDRGTPLSYAMQNAKFDVATLLVKNGADVNLKDNNGVAPLMYAVVHNSLEMVIFLWQNKAELNAAANNGATALNLATQRGYTGIADFLKNPTEPPKRQ